MARVTLPALMQLVHTRIRLGVPFTEARTVCKLGNHLRLVLGARKAHAPEWTCLMFWPNCGPLPQTSHIFDISEKAPVLEIANYMGWTASPPEQAAWTTTDIISHKWRFGKHEQR